MKTSESIKSICTALLEAQKNIGAAKKGAVNPFFHSKYADLGSVMEACKEELNKNGITVLQPIVGMTVETVLIHTSGEWMTSETPIVCKVDNDPQALGSAITYSRRYALQSFVFIPAEDDDGNTASQRQAKPEMQTTRPDLDEHHDIKFAGGGNCTYRLPSGNMCSIATTKPIKEFSIKVFGQDLCMVHQKMSKKLQEGNKAHEAAS